MQHELWELTTLKHISELAAGVALCICECMMMILPWHLQGSASGPG